MLQSIPEATHLQLLVLYISSLYAQSDISLQK